MDGQGTLASGQSPAAAAQQRDDPALAALPDLVDGRVGAGYCSDNRLGQRPVSTGGNAISADLSAGACLEPAPERQAPRHRSDSATRSEEHTSELQSRFDLVCRLL